MKEKNEKPISGKTELNENELEQVSGGSVKLIEGSNIKIDEPTVKQAFVVELNTAN